MKTADSRSLAGMGFLPFQAHNARWDLDKRPAILGVRYVDRLDAPNEYGHFVEDSATRGDLINSFFWPADGAARPMGAWMFASAAVVGGPSGGDVATSDEGICATHPGGLSILPVFDRLYTPDSRFISRSVGTHIKQKLPTGTIGIALAGTKEGFQEDLFLPTDMRLAAVNKGGDPDMSTPVHELRRDFRHDPALFARLHQFWRVVDHPLASGFNSLAWQLGPSGCQDTEGGMVSDLGSIAPEGGSPVSTGGTPRPDTPTGFVGGPVGDIPFGDRTQITPSSGALTDNQGNRLTRDASLRQVSDNMDAAIRRESIRTSENTAGVGIGGGAQETGSTVFAAASVRKGGPLDVSGKGDRHQIGKTADGTPIFALHLSTSALFRRDNRFDGPFLFEGDFEDPGESPKRTRGHIKFDGGFWRIECEATTYVVPPKEKKPPPGKPPPPNTPTPGLTDSSTSVGGGGQPGGGSTGSSGSGGLPGGITVDPKIPGTSGDLGDIGPGDPISPGGANVDPPGGASGGIEVPGVGNVPTAADVFGGAENVPTGVDPNGPFIQGGDPRIRQFLSNPVVQAGGGDEFLTPDDSGQFMPVPNKIPNVQPRQKGEGDKQFVATTMESAAPTLLSRPQSFADGMPDLRNDPIPRPSVQKGLVDDGIGGPLPPTIGQEGNIPVGAGEQGLDVPPDIDGSTPVTGRIEGVGAQGGCENPNGYNET